MNHTSWVIQVLGDLHKRNLEFPNRFWLRQNVEGLHIYVSVNDCIVNTFDIEKKWREKGTLLIQEGKNIHLNDFDSKKEALFLVKNELENTYNVFLYSPKE